MKFTYEICYSDYDIERAEDRLMQASLIANDIETIPFQKKKPNQPFAMTINAYSGLIGNRVESYCFPFQKGKSLSSDSPANLELIYETCGRLNDSGIRFTGHNYVYDLAWFLRYGLPVRNYAYDSMTLWWSLYPELPKKLDFVASILDDSYQYWKAGRKSNDFEAYCKYGMLDTKSTLISTLKLLEIMGNDSKMRTNFYHAHMRNMIGLSMSMKGMRANQDTLDVYNEELSAVAEDKLARLRYLIDDPEFNPNSPKQKHFLLYSLMGVKMRNARGRFVNKPEQASTGAMVLRAVRNEHPVFRRVVNGILEAIEPAKQLSNVVGMAQFPTPNGKRFITSYDGTGTTTTRFSSRGSAFGHGGNAQNIRKDYRTFIEADKDSFLLDLDFSGADEVFVSFESEDPKKMELIRSGKDIHASNALIFFTNWDYESIVKGKHAGDPVIVHPITGIRQITKKLVHGNNYLMAGLTLLMTAGREAIVAAAKELGNTDAGTWSQQELAKFCEGLESKFRNHYIRFKRTGEGSWYMDVQREVAETGGFTTIFNYFQRFLGDPKDDSVLRACAATAGQANTAGRINMVCEELFWGARTLQFRDGSAPDYDDPARTISESTHGIGLRLQTHDSLTFNVRHTHPNWREGVENILHVMRRPVLCKKEVFQVGIEGEISYRWGGKEGLGGESVEACEKFLQLPREKIPEFDAVRKRRVKEKDSVKFAEILKEISS